MNKFYRNWVEICKIGRKDNLLMLVLATVCLDENDPIFLGLYCGFPQCFGDKKTEGPFPLSVLRELGGQTAVRFGRPWEEGANHPDSYDVTLKLSVPSIIFQVNDDHVDAGVGWPFFPMKLAEARKLKQGDIFEWHSNKLVILECRFNDRSAEYAVVASPVASIDLGL